MGIRIDKTPSHKKAKAFRVRPLRHPPNKPIPEGGRTPLSREDKKFVPHSKEVSQGKMLLLRNPNAAPPDIPKIISSSKRNLTAPSGCLSTGT